MENSKTKNSKKRKSGIPTGNAGEYFVMGELLRQGFDAQLADRNTKAYDLLVGHTDESILHKVQVKSVRVPPWYVKQDDFKGSRSNQITIYVIIGKEDSQKPVRFFIAKNRNLKKHLKFPESWTLNGFMSMAAVKPFENNWKTLRELRP